LIIILKRNDLLPQFTNVSNDKIKLFHFGLERDTIDRAHLIVFLDNNSVHVLNSRTWPLGKPMSAIQLLHIIAEHAK
jgi:hypothetical protein